MNGMNVINMIQISSQNQKELNKIIVEKGSKK